MPDMYVMVAFPEQAMSGMAAAFFLRSVIAGAVPIFLDKLYDMWGVGWTFTLLAVVALVFAPVPWIRYWYGEKEGEIGYGSRW